MDYIGGDIIGISPEYLIFKSSLDFFYKIRTFAADLIEFKYLWTVQP